MRKLKKSENKIDKKSEESIFDKVDENVDKISRYKDENSDEKGRKQDKEKE